MTTLSVDNDLYQLTSEAAAALGKTVDEFVGDALRKALAGSGVRRTERNGLPVMVVNEGTPAIDPAAVQRCIEEEGA